ncbi:Uroporphyrinogen decarboxylase [Candidatus Rhabdochlamydia oedothoracis]|uniref:Uroporphyrinogen decarboxylase n=1 Tax=Candidatus Rhabdochlamydia oedothoracis TaxID=2720720 RepID=A0ABX8V230_9BACT|nr:MULTISPECIES: uroporphyrinogen decarboxylase [Rhabdochlamydia]KAG6559831.1 Uroporphyrinogen decarboxylase [Candidatus Rhabdochlamydia sp. W815]MCL6756401.1 uroporphyrinogen decarboxylase [Candidatus Rhabdochlamydia oedothoracis]QYF49249.1 Uroporphyrinogen decarboxylase [Candidatus Rhabdochlamydia oedothoracis]
MNDLLLRALRCEKVERAPIWLMRQAGRYMPQYQLLRKKYSLWQLFHIPELAAEVSYLPIDLLDVDAAIVFSDILVLAEGLGLKLEFSDKGGPRIYPPIRTKQQVKQLSTQAVEEKLTFVFKILQIVKKQIQVPLIGFCGGPFTVATYLIDSTSKEPFLYTKQWMEKDPQSFMELLAILTKASITYLKAQVQAGADVVQVFDSWASILSEEEFQQFCLPFLHQIVKELQLVVPVILFCRDSSIRYAQLADLMPTAISLDWHLPMKVLREKISSSIALQGNLRPELLKKPSSEIEKEVSSFLNSMKGGRGFIANLGHGVLPDIPFESVKLFVDMAKSATI